MQRRHKTAMLMEKWNSSQPIFVQIRQKIVELILKGHIGEGKAIPSVRQTATDLSVNPLTVTKAYQALVDVNVLEKKRGMGMFVTEGARDALLNLERERFVKEEWPHISQQIKLLGLNIVELSQSTDTDTGDAK